MVDMVEENGYVRITYEAPTRGLLGYRSEFINDTRGEGTLVRRIKGYTPYKGEITQRANGAMTVSYTHLHAYVRTNILIHIGSVTNKINKFRFLGDA